MANKLNLSNVKLVKCWFGTLRPYVDFSDYVYVNTSELSKQVLNTIVLLGKMTHRKLPLCGPLKEKNQSKKKWNLLKGQRKLQNFPMLLTGWLKSTEYGR